MIDGFTWRDLAPAAVVATFIGGLVMLLIRAHLAKDFARRADVSDLAARMGRMEDGLKAVPTHGDMRAIGDRVAAVEVRIASAGATIDGVREDVRGVQHDLRLLMTHLMSGKTGA